MFRILKLVLLAYAANCAPTTFIPLSAPLPQSYFLIGQPQSQFQYQPLLKIQQPDQPATKIDAPKGQYVFLYQNAPQVPLLALRQDGGTDILSSFNNWWSDFSQNWGGQNPAPTTEKPPPMAGESSEVKLNDVMLEKQMLEKNTQPMQPMQPLLPASTMPLNMNKQRFYVINSLPQFYGNFAALPTVANPILAIEPIRARSVGDSAIPAEAENEQIEQLRSQDAMELVQQPAVVQSIPQLQLRSNIVEPLQRLEVNQPQIPIVDNEPVPEVAAQELARFLDQARSQDAGPNTANALNENEANKLRADAEPMEDETSIAQSNPSGIALSGKGGVSKSASVATAVVGEGGLALASPSSIALSGDFEDQEKKLKEKQMEP